MKHTNTRARFGSCILHFALCILLILLAACGSRTWLDSSKNTSSDTGSIAFNVAWEGTTIQSAVHQAAQPPSGDVCVDYGIDTMSADVYNATGTIVASASWSCSDHQGTISDVPTGSGMRLILEGTVSGSVDWQGEVTGITVSAGATYPAGTVTMNYIGNDTNPPDVASTNPTSGGTDVALDAVITAEFSEEIVEASVESPSAFTLMNGTTPVSGSIAYDPSTFTATFTPDSDLSHFTTYTATITTDVQDMAGIQMASSYTWTFTTANIAWIEEARAVVKISSSQEELVRVDTVNCSSLSGWAQFALDPNDNSLWIADTNNNRIIKLDEQGELIVLMDQYSAQGTAVDPRDGSMWSSQYISGLSRKLVKRDSIGLKVLETAIGLTGSMIDNAMSWYSGDNSLWFADYSTNIVKLWGTDTQLSGYDLSGPSGTYHLRIGGFVGQPFTVSVYPGDGMGGPGHVWASDRDGAVIKFSTGGSELLSRTPSGFFEVRHVSADISSGDVWLAAGNPDRVAKYDASGNELVNIGGFTAPFGTIEADPNDGGAWVGYSGGLVKLSSTGSEEWRRSSGSVNSIVLLPQNRPPTPVCVSENGDDTTGNGSSDNPYRTIGKAINEATSGGTVLVAAGTYDENITLKSRIKIIGAGSSDTTIQGLGTTNVIDGVGVQNVTVQGFTITGSSDTTSGIYCSDCTALIIRGSSIVDNGNSTTSNGILLQGTSTALIEQNVISGNSDGGITVSGDSRAIIRNNIIANNGDCGIYRSSGNWTTYITNNVIDSNGTELGGRSGIMTFSEDIISNNIITNNGSNNPNPGLSVGIYSGGGDPPILSYNNVWGNFQGSYTGVSAGTGDISAEPSFVDPSSEDYQLQFDSPCINTGSPSLCDEGVACGETDSRSDMGAYGGPWGDW